MGTECQKSDYPGFIQIIEEGWGKLRGGLAQK